MKISISHEWIYQYVLKNKLAGGSLYLHLRCKKKRKKRYGSNERRGILKNRIGIDQRPAIVDTRSRVGDWEADTIIGKAHKQAIVSITERKSGLALIYKVDRRTKENTEGAIKRLWVLSLNKFIRLRPIMEKSLGTMKDRSGTEM